jgi:hypothetical protein
MKYFWEIVYAVVAFIGLINFCLIPGYMVYIKYGFKKGVERSDSLQIVCNYIEFVAKNETALILVGLSILVCMIWVTDALKTVILELKN